jgi:hypothetical protein
VVQVTPDQSPVEQAETLPLQPKLLVSCWQMPGPLALVHGPAVPGQVAGNGLAAAARDK